VTPVAPSKATPSTQAPPVPVSLTHPAGSIDADSAVTTAATDGGSGVERVTPEATPDTSVVPNMGAMATQSR
jgi:hypothetical protein